MPDLAAAYADTRETMMKIVRDLPPEKLGARVPACPAWNVQDLIAHVTSLASSLASGEFPPDLNPLASLFNSELGEKRDTFVDAALEARRGLTIEQILSEWERSAPRVEAMIRGAEPWPPSAPPLVEWVVTTDLAAHDHDLRGALDLPGERDSIATGLSRSPDQIRAFEWQGDPEPFLSLFYPYGLRTDALVE
ncbi:MAG: maleylpyruvate isomerase family mycothiol-dependent enzyme [Actinobacteria bacterium]|nr:maleylpyruvate isomerase family mycothiol-dependent enzyme [Actinomycetota bacterium]